MVSRRKGVFQGRKARPDALRRAGGDKVKGRLGVVDSVSNTLLVMLIVIITLIASVSTHPPNATD